MLKRAIHPGKFLKDELDEFGISPTELARQINVPANRLSQIINAKRAITGDTALRLGHWFKTDPKFRMILQTQFYLVAAEHEAGELMNILPTCGSERYCVFSKTVTVIRGRCRGILGEANF